MPVHRESGGKRRISVEFRLAGPWTPEPESLVSETLHSRGGRQIPQIDDFPPYRVGITFCLEIETTWTMLAPCPEATTDSRTGSSGAT